MGGLLKNNFKVPEQRGVFDYDALLDQKQDYTKRLGEAASYANVASSGAQQGSFTTGILGGAASGAAIGSLFPGAGTAIGAVAGGLVGGISTAIGRKNKPEETEAQRSYLENMRLQNEALKKQYDEAQQKIEWYTKLKNGFKYR